jgi:hypothetical protein
MYFSGIQVIYKYLSNSFVHIHLFGPARYASTFGSSFLAGQILNHDLRAINGGTGWSGPDGNGQVMKAIADYAKANVAELEVLLTICYSFDDMALCYVIFL